MGQKVNPHGLRVGVIKEWSSNWYADKKSFSDNLVEDYKIREYLKKELYQAGVSKLKIERTRKKIKVTIYTAKPGIVIGRGGEGIEALKKKIERLTTKAVLVNVEEVRKPDLDAQLVAENIAFQLERRITFRRAMKGAIQRTMKEGAKGIKTQVSGRLGGADMARSEGYSEGTIPLQTLRADIDYGFAEANTTYGKIGVKVWLYKGEVLPEVTDERKKNFKKRNQDDKKKDFKKRRRNNGQNTGFKDRKNGERNNNNRRSFKPEAKEAQNANNEN